MLSWFIALYGFLSAAMVTGLARLRVSTRTETEDPPSVAVVVAARNEAEKLPRLLTALKQQQYPAGRISFWIVDDESEDDTFSIARSAAENDSRFHALKTDTSANVASPKKRALDTAIRKAEAEWIVTTDADCTPGPGWVRALSDYMKPGTGAVVGYAPLTGGHDPISWLMEGESWSSAALAAAGIGLGYPFNAMGRNFAFRRKIYLDLGGYGAGSGMASGDDDLFLQYIAARTNWKAVFAADPAAVVPSEVPRSVDAFRTKSRHMSAGPKYAAGWVVIGAVGNVLFMGLAFATLLCFFNKKIRERVAVAWAAKWFFDLVMAAAGTRVLKDKRRAALAVVTMSVAPFALWAIWPKALFGTVVWKGRSFERGRADRVTPTAKETE